MPQPIEIPLPDPLGLLEAEARATGAPVIPIDPLAALGKRPIASLVKSQLFQP